jgi:UDP-N-acetylmuramyl pentapeptide synthase
MKLTLREVAEMLDLSPPPENSAGIVTGWSVDSRTLQPGDLYLPCGGRITTGTLTSRNVSRRAR